MWMKIVYYHEKKKQWAIFVYKINELYKFSTFFLCESCKLKKFMKLQKLLHNSLQEY